MKASPPRCFRESRSVAMFTSASLRIPAIRAIDPFTSSATITMV